LSGTMYSRTLAAIPETIGNRTTTRTAMTATRTSRAPRTVRDLVEGTGTFGSLRDDNPTSPRADQGPFHARFPRPSTKGLLEYRPSGTGINAGGTLTSLPPLDRY
jgi:hypothetical protein